jgi:hypothetical protein
MKVVVPIPVNGRIPLLKHTVNRLYFVNKVHKVILIGDSIEVKQIAEALNCEYVYHPNYPLGAKWNAGFKACEKYNPDAVLFCGSSDWISEDYLSFCDKSFDVAGKLGCHFADVGQKENRAVFWEGYKEPKRKGETIGIGRVLSSRILKKMNWTPFEDTRDSSLDYSMWNKCIALNGKFQTIPAAKGQLLSISHYSWVNKHKFDEHWSNKIPSIKIDVKELLTEFTELELL